MLIHMSKIALKRLVEIVAIAIILFAILLNMGRIIVPMLSHKRLFFEDWASQTLKQPVSIGKITAGWNEFEPVVTFDHVIVKKPVTNHTAIKINKLSIGINLFSSLLHGKLLPGHIFVSGTQFTVLHNQQNQLIIKGLPIARFSMQQQSNQTQLKALWKWLMTQTDISLNHIKVKYIAENGAQLTIKNLSVDVINRYSEHRMTGVANFQQKMPNQVRFILNIANFDSKQFAAKLFIAVKNLDLYAWYKIKPIQALLPDVKLTQGVLGGHFWLTWKAGKLKTVQSVFALKHVSLATTQQQKMANLIINHLSANAIWLHDQSGWKFLSDHLLLTINGKSWPQNRFGVRAIDGDTLRSTQYIVKTHFIRLTDFQFLAKHLALGSQQLHQALSQLNPKGDLHDFTLSAFKQNHQLKLTIASRFDDLSFSNWQNIPGVTHISGRIYYSPQGGDINISGKNADLQLPTLFNQDLSGLDFNVKASWVLQNGKLNFNLQHYDVCDKNLTSEGQLKIDQNSQGHFNTNLLIGFQVLNVNQIQKYLPNKILNPNLYRWLSSAFSKGQLQHGVMIFRGDLAAFPFDQHQGHFEVLTHLKDITLNYAPHWPVLQHINGSLKFDGRKMLVNSQTGMIAGNNMTAITAVIPNLQNSVLKISGQSQTDLAQAQYFLNHSPLQIAKSLSTVILQGPMHLNLNLIVPLSDDHSRTQSKGVIQVNNAQLNLPDWDIKLSHLVGQLTFNNQQLTARNLQGQLWGRKINFNINTLNPKNSASVVRVEMGGVLDTAQIARSFQFPLLKDISGATAYRAILSLHDEGSDVGNQLSLMTDLNGVEISHLPAPFNKPKKTKRQLLFQLNFKKNNGLQAYIQYGKLISQAVTLVKNDKNLKVQSADLELGGAPASFKTGPGIIISGELPVFDIKEWNNVMNSLFPNNSTQQNMLLSEIPPLRYLELDIKQVNLNSWSLKDVYLKLIPHKKDIRFIVQNHDLAGIIIVPQKFDSLWHIYLQHLYLPKLKISQQKTAIDPAKIPPLDIAINDFRYQKRDYGELQLLTSKTKLGLEINKLVTKSSLLTSQLTGEWYRQGSHFYTSLKGTLISHDFGKLLSRFGITKRLHHGNGAMTFVSHWQGAPYDYNTRTLNGELKIKLMHGEFLQLSKNAQAELGLGRLLNLFSVESIFKHLTFNFSDLTEKGFGFNILTSDFVFSEGYATTLNTIIEGPIAKVIIRGGFNMLKPNYNMMVTVDPYVTSSLPFIAGIAGGPLAGALTWIVNKMVSPGLSRVMGTSYLVTGSRQHPTITKIKDEV